jgi:hypothetical protein
VHMSTTISLNRGPGLGDERAVGCRRRETRTKVRSITHTIRTIAPHNTTAKPQSTLQNKLQAAVALTAHGQARPCRRLAVLTHSARDHFAPSLSQPAKVIATHMTAPAQRQHRICDRPM